MLVSSCDDLVNRRLAARSARYERFANVSLRIDNFHAVIIATQSPCIGNLA